MVAGYLLPSVNDATKKYAPEEAIDQIGSVLPRIIEALTMAPVEDGGILFSKLDIKDGFWCMGVKRDKSGTLLMFSQTTRVNHPK